MRFLLSRQLHFPSKRLSRIPSHQWVAGHFVRKFHEMVISFVKELGFVVFVRAGRTWQLNNDAL